MPSLEKQLDQMRQVLLEHRVSPSQSFHIMNTYEQALRTAYDRGYLDGERLARH